MWDPCTWGTDGRMVWYMGADVDTVKTDGIWVQMAEWSGIGVQMWDPGTWGTDGRMEWYMGADVGFWYMGDRWQD